MREGSTMGDDITQSDMALMIVDFALAFGRMPTDSELPKWVELSLLGMDCCAEIEGSVRQ
jgi:hypothetical protein